MAPVKNPASRAAGRVESRGVGSLATRDEIANVCFTFKRLVAALATLGPASLVAIGTLIIAEVRR